MPLSEAPNVPTGSDVVTISVDLLPNPDSIVNLERSLNQVIIQFQGKMSRIEDMWESAAKRGISAFDSASLDSTLDKLRDSFTEAVSGINESALTFQKVIPFGEEEARDALTYASAVKTTADNIEIARIQHEAMSGQLKGFKTDFIDIQNIKVSGNIISQITSINEKLANTDFLMMQVKEQKNEMLEASISEDAIDDLSAKLQAFSNELETEIPKAWNSFATKGLVAVTAMATGALFAYSGVESVVTDLEIRLGEAAGTAEELRSKLNEVAREINTSLRDAAGAYTIATRLGKTKEETDELTLSLADLATVTGDLTGATGATVFAMSTYGEAAGTAEEISFKLFKAWQLAGIGASEIQNIIAQLGPTASQAGVGMDELITSTILVAQRGISASQTMTGLIQLFTKLQSPTGELADAFSALGITSLPQAIEKFGSLAGVLNALNQYANENGVAFTKLVGGYRTLRVASALAESAGESYITTLEDVTTVTEELSDAALLKADDLAQGFVAFKREVTAAFSEVGAGIAPILGFFTGLASSMAKNAEHSDNVALALRLVGKAMTVLIGLFVLAKFGLWVQAWRNQATAVQKLIAGLRVLIPTSKAAALSQVELAAGAKTAEAGLARLGLMVKTAAISIAALAAVKVWQAIQDRLAKIAALTQDIIDNFKELEGTSVQDFGNSVGDALEPLLERDEDFGTLLHVLNRLKITYDDFAQSAAKNGAIFKTVGSYVENLVESGGIFASDAMRDLERKLGQDGEIRHAVLDSVSDLMALVENEFLSTGETTAGIDLLEFLGFGTDTDIYQSALEAATVLEEAAEIATDSLRSSVEELIGGAISDSSFDILKSRLVDNEDDLIDIFKNIEEGVSSQINSLLRTIFTDPIEQMEGGAEAFAETLLHNVEVIERWKETIAAFEDTGDLKLAEQLTQLGPQYTAAFVDIFNQGSTVRDAFEGMLREVTGGLSTGEAAGTFGNSVADIFANDEFLKRMVSGYGVEALGSYVDGLVNLPDDVKADTKKALANLFTPPEDVSEAADALATYAVGVITPVLSVFGTGGEQGGSLYGRGVKTGIELWTTAIYHAAYGAAEAAIRGGNDGFQNRSPSKLGIETGVNYMKGIWTGILKNLKTDAARVGKAVGTAINSAISVSMREGISNLGSAFKTIFGANDIQRQIDDAITGITDLIIRYEDELPAEIAAMEEALELAKKIGGAGVVTAAEQVSIEAAEKKVKDLKLAYEQGFVSAAELQAAEDELVKTREESIEKTDEVISLEEDLVSLNEELAGSAGVIAEAMENLNRLYIDAALYMFDVVDAIHEIEASGPEVYAAFETMAEAAGIPAEAFDAMVGTVKASMTVYKESIESTGVKIHFDPGRNATTGGGGGGGGGGIIPVINYDVPDLFVKVIFKPELSGGSGVEVPEEIWGLIRDGHIIGLYAGGSLAHGKFAIAGERGPELVRGPATVMGTKETASLLGRGTGGGNVYHLDISVTPSWPIDYDESRAIAGNIRDSILELEREEV